MTRSDPRHGHNVSCRQLNDYWRARGKSKEDAVKGSAKRFLGIDLGASSGRIFLGTLENGRLSISKFSGFPNQGYRISKGFTGILLGSSRRSRKGSGWLLRIMVPVSTASV